MSSVSLAGIVITLLFMSSFLSKTQTLQERSASAAEPVITPTFVTTTGANFMENGNPFYFAGANTYDVFTYGEGSATQNDNAIEDKYIDKARIDAHMQRLAESGVTIVRLWAYSHEDWHGFEPTKGGYNEAQFRLFDYIIQSAKNHKLKLQPVFENYWEAYGGIDKRLAWEGLPGGTATNRSAFFNKEKCPGCFDSYKQYVAYVLNRRNHYTGVLYKDEPTIFAWELMNEPRYQDAVPNENTTGETLRAWVDEMGQFVKSHDSNHLLTIGLEGHGSNYGFGGDQGNPFVYLHESPYIDFTTAHIYPNEDWSNLTMEQTTDVLEKWISDAHTIVGKPFVLAEFNTKNVDRPTWWSEIYKTLEEHNAGGSAFWNYVSLPTTGEYDVIEGPELAVFKEHAARMAEKKELNPAGTVSATPTEPLQ